MPLQTISLQTDTLIESEFRLLLWMFYETDVSDDEVDLPDIIVLGHR